MLDLLRSFNRKERFFLVGAALGKPDFRLDERFRAGVGAALRLTVPHDAFVAMDYHMSWLYAALVIHASPAATPPFANADGLVSANQEDVDLLIAYRDGATFAVILLEAKGVTGWTTKQSGSKVRRLCAVFGEDGRRVPGVRPHFVIASPRRPTRLKTAEWPAWMAPRGEVPWMPLAVPGNLKVVTRCDAEGRRSAAGGYWTVVDERDFARGAPAADDSEVV